MHNFPFLILLLFSSFSLLPNSTLCSSSSTPTNNTNTNSSSTSLKPSDLSSIQSLCKSTVPHPELCSPPPPLNTSKLSLSLSLGIAPAILNLLLHTLDTAIGQAAHLSSTLSSTNNHNKIVETQRGTLLDCKELHQISLLSLRRSRSRLESSRASDAKAFLSAALANRATCLEGLASASGPGKPALVASILDAYRHVENSLSLVSLDVPGVGGGGEEAGQGDDGGDEAIAITVAKDGSGNFTRVQDAVDFAPNNSEYRTFIYVRRGVYEENVEIPSYKTNIVLLGEGSDSTVITGSRSVADGWTTFRSATVAVSGEGFLARDLGFSNTAGPEKHQAVALRVNADLAAVYRCAITGYQDTLYAHSFRQFYRECDIYGTIDFIFGNAAAVFQGCNIVSRMPLPGQFTVVTAQGRDLPEETTGISIQNCSVVATEELYNNRGSVKSYLGRPWRKYSRTVYIESYIDDFVDPSGWVRWSDDGAGLDTLYYGEYDNSGPGSGTEGRVSWAGYHVMGYDEASNFTVSQFIVGDEWLDSTAFPYDDGI